MFIKDALLDDNQFSWQRALNCAAASQLAYSDAGKIQAETARWGFDHSEFFSEKKTQGFIAWDAEIVLVSFRGTKELGDWLTNLNVARSQHPPPYGKVHTGFYEGFNDARGRVSEILDKAAPDGKRVWITGHSLGGALSTIMAAEFLEQIKLSGVYTFGQPRVVNRRTQGLFRTHYHDRFFRIVNDDDIVPKVPPLLKHVGTILWFDEDGSLKKAPEGVRSDDFGPEELTEEEFEDEKNKLRSFLRQINEAQEEAAALDLDEIAEQEEEPGEEVRGLFPSVRDHFMDKYIQKVLAKLNSST